MPSPHGVPPPTSLLQSLRYIGPGLILTAGIVGTGELVVTPHVAAENGFALLWLIILGCVVKVFVQVELGRYAVATNTPTLRMLDLFPGPRWRVGWMVWLFFPVFLAMISVIGGMLGGIAQVFVMMGVNTPPPVIAAAFSVAVASTFSAAIASAMAVTDGVSSSAIMSTAASAVATACTFAVATSVTAIATASNLSAATVPPTVTTAEPTTVSTAAAFSAAASANMRASFCARRHSPVRRSMRFFMSTGVPTGPGALTMNPVFGVRAGPFCRTAILAYFFLTMRSSCTG